MIKSGRFDAASLVRGLSGEAREEWKRLEDGLSRALQSLVSGAEESGADVGAISSAVSELFDRALQRLEDTGDPSAVLGAGELLRRASERIRDGDVAEKVKKISRAISKWYDDLVSEHVAPRLLESMDPSNLSTEQWNRLLKELEDLDVTGAGRGPGGGIADAFLVKVFMDPRTRYRIRSYLKDLRTAPYVRRVYGTVGKHLDVRRTFRETSRAGMPLLVFEKPSYRPRTREDVVFLYDVSGSMLSTYALVASFAKALSELGLRVRVWYAEEGAVKASPRDPLEVLKSFGGGGTNLDLAVRTVLDKEHLRNTTFIVYTDLEEGGDWNGFVEGLKEARSRGAYVAVFITDCDAVRDELSDLDRAGIKYVCDVRSLRSMVDAIRQVKYYIKKSVVVR